MPLIAQLTSIILTLTITVAVNFDPCLWPTNWPILGQGETRRRGEARMYCLGAIAPSHGDRGSASL